jgi:hypothetical protein
LKKALMLVHSSTSIRGPESAPRANDVKRTDMGSTIIEEKAANALIEQVSPSAATYALAMAMTPEAPVSAIVVMATTLTVAKKALGGLWVGGRVLLRQDELAFEPNRMNAALHQGVLTIRIPYSEVQSVERCGGVVSGKIRIVTELGAVLLRVFGADGFAERIRQLCPKLKL